MKYSIFSLLFFVTISSCSEQRQMEEEESLSYSDFFLSRSEKAKNNRKQNYSASPAVSPEAGPLSYQQQEEEEPKVLEGIIPEGQEESPYFESDGEREEVREGEDYSLEEEGIQEEEAITPKAKTKKSKEYYSPEEVRLWR